MGLSKSGFDPLQKHFKVTHSTSLNEIFLKEVFTLQEAISGTVQKWSLKDHLKVTPYGLTENHRKKKRAFAGNKLLGCLVRDLA